MATLTVEVPDSVAAVLGAPESLRLESYSIMPLIEDVLYELRDSLSSTVEAGGPRAGTLRTFAKRLTDCADAIDATDAPERLEVPSTYGTGRITALREAMGLSREEVAERVGMNLGRFLRWEHEGISEGERDDPAVTGLCELFGVRAGRLVDEEA